MQATVSLTTALYTLVVGLGLGAAIGATAALVLVRHGVEQSRERCHTRVQRAHRAAAERPVIVQRPAWLDELTTPELEIELELAGVNPHAMRADRLAEVSS